MVGTNFGAWTPLTTPPLTFSVHYPGDVLGGFLVGWGVGALALQMARHWVSPLADNPSTSHG